VDQAPNIDLRRGPGKLVYDKTRRTIVAVIDPVVVHRYLTERGFTLPPTDVLVHEFGCGAGGMPPRPFLKREA